MQSIQVTSKSKTNENHFEMNFVGGFTRINAEDAPLGTSWYCNLRSARVFGNKNKLTLASDI